MSVRGEGVLVFDLGSVSLRVGRAVDKDPMAEIPSVVGVSIKGTAANSDSAKPNDNRINKNIKYYIGEKSLSVPRPGKSLNLVKTYCFTFTIRINVVVFFFNSGMEVKNCVKDCMIDDWDLFEQMLDYAYSNCLAVESHCYPVLFTEWVLNTKPKRETLVELMFEKYNLPAIYLCNSGSLATIGLKCSTALVIDCGATHTSVIPVNSCSVVSDAISKSPVGGDFINMECKQYFKV
jgi:actin-related protein